MTAAEPSRYDLIRRAIWLERLTAAWMLIEAAIAIGSGVLAGSLSLIAFGADSLIEFASAGVVLWRLNFELREGTEFPENMERRASRIAGALLFALAAYVIGSATYGLWRKEGQEFSAPGFVLTLFAIPIMLVLAKAKIRIADRIGSSALRADAIESIACAYLAGIVVLGLLAQLFTGWWWIDSVTSLAIVVLLIKEGREAWYSDEGEAAG
jgi:divalent metal cation (Fe/Co/Zn/Cd) transporter